MTDDEFGDDENNYVVVSRPEKSTQELLRLIQELKAWLSPTDTTSPASEYRKHLNSHVAGTGEWILDTNQYRRWSDTDEIGDLWIRGIPGSGKSVVAASMVKRLQQRGDAPVLFFFFREIIEANRTPHSLARDFCHGLLDQSPILQSTLERLKEQNKSINNVPFNELWKCLASALAAMPKVYCVIDALDEMEPGHDQFLQDVLNLGRNFPQSIKLILTSRQLPHLEKHLGGSCLVDLRLDRRNVDNDIAIYITKRLESETILTENESVEIKKAICDRGKGLFLYARLVTDQLLQHPSIIVSQLKQLPQDLGSMYSSILQDHASRSQTTAEFQRLVLEFVVRSVRPLRLLEMAAMVDSLPDRGGLSQDQDAKVAIRSTCGPLLEVCEDGVIQIIHHSMTEFLLNRDVSHIQDESGTREFAILDFDIAHENMTRACLNYITRCFAEALDEYIQDPRDYIRALWQRFPFLRYASSHWPFHAFMVSETDEFISFLDAFLKQGPRFTWWATLWDGLDIDVDNNFTTLHLAAHTGLRAYAEHLLLNGADPECRDGYGRTPITHAALEGHAKVVQTLLSYKARYDLVDDDMKNALHYAAKADQSEVVRVLMAEGADPLAAVQKKQQDESGCMRGKWYSYDEGQTALSFTCRLGHLETLNEIQTYIDPLTLRRKALPLAASCGQAEIVSRLLQDDEIRCGINDLHHGDTVLYLAAKSQSSATVQVLLESGADISIASLDKPKENGDTKAYLEEEHERRFTPIHGWAGLSGVKDRGEGNTNEKDREVLQILINAGCDVNTTDHRGRTALFAWNDFQYGPHLKKAIDFVSWLLENGADASIVAMDGETPLHGLGYKPEEQDIVRLLGKAGSNINAARKTDGMTPLHLAGKNRSLMDPQVFAEVNGDFQKQDSEGNTPLHYIVASWSLRGQTAEKWLSLGFSETRNHAGRTPLTEFLWHAVFNENEANSILRIFLEHGADLESRDFDGRTALLTSLSRGARYRSRYLSELLRLGADVKARDFRGKSALHYAANPGEFGGCESVEYSKALVQILLDAGADINSVDYDGNSIFHETITEGWGWARYYTQALLEFDVPLHVRNYQGRTALHIAAGIHDNGPQVRIAQGGPTQLEFLLHELRYDINAQDHEGTTPMHIAAATSDAIVLLLLKNGANIEAKTIYGRTALHYAAEAGQSNCVGLLIDEFRKRDLPLNDVSIVGRTALHEAAKSGRHESVQLLLEAGLRPDVCDSQGKTALHAAAEFDQLSHLKSKRKSYEPSLAKVHNGQQGAVEVLEKLGLVICSEDYSRSIREVVQILLASEADPLQRDKAGYTPTDIASIHDLPDVVDELAQSMGQICSPDGETLKPSLLDPIGGALHISTPEDYATFIDRIPANSPNYIVLKRVISTGNVKMLEEILHSPKIDLTESDKAAGLQLCSRWGLLSMTKSLLPYTESRAEILPLLLDSATQRSLCNIDMVCLLIETAGREAHDKDSIQGMEIKQQLNSGVALHRLASGKFWWYPQALTVLLETGADTELLEKGRTPLQTVLVTGTESGPWRDEVFDILLNHGADVNARLAQSETCPLQDAVENKRDTSIVQRLLDHGASVKHKPIVASAIRAGSSEALELVLKAGADPNVMYEMRHCSTPGARETPLKHASAQSERLMEVLLAYGANPLQPLYDGTSSVLHEICSLNGRVNPIVAAGFDLEARDAKGQTPLMRACLSRGYNNQIARHTNGPIGSAIELIGSGVKVNAVDDSGSTALHYAICSSLTNVIAKLLQHGAPLAVRNKHGLTPLDCALVGEIDSCESDPDEYRIPCDKVIRLLLEAGADPLAPLPDGKTALHCIMPGLMQFTDEGRAERSSLGKKTDNDRDFCNYAALYQEFIDAGCSREARDNKGNTPIFAFVSTVRFYHTDIEQRSSPDLDDIRQVLTEHDAFAVNDDGDTLLHAVASRGEDVGYMQDHDVMLFKLLLELGLDPTVENKGGATPLDVADAFDRDEILAMFARDE